MQKQDRKCSYRLPFTTTELEKRGLWSQLSKICEWKWDLQIYPNLSAFFVIWPSADISSICKLQVVDFDVIWCPTPSPGGNFRNFVFHICERYLEPWLSVRCLRTKTNNAWRLTAFSFLILLVNRILILTKKGEIHWGIERENLNYIILFPNW